MFGSPLAGYVADRWGRKTCLAVNVIPYLLGYFAILTTYLFVEDAIFFKVILVSGRFISGIGTGWSFVIVPVCFIVISVWIDAYVRGWDI